jgi:hypothetical protein
MAVLFSTQNQPRAQLDRAWSPNFELLGVVFRP